MYCLRTSGLARSLLNPIIPNNLSLNDKQCEKLIDEVATDAEVFANFIAEGNGHQKLKDRWDQIANRLNPAGPAKKTGEKWKEVSCFSLRFVSEYPSAVS